MNLEFLLQNFRLWGFTPKDIYNKYIYSNLPKILANSIPKSGTHLIERLLYLTPGISRQFGRTVLPNQTDKFFTKINKLKNSQFLVAHLYYNNDINKIIKENNTKMLFLYRDPRDIVISKYKYITYKNKNHRLHSFYLGLGNDYLRLKTAIIGDSSVGASSIYDDLMRFTPWINIKNSLSIKYENLIGEKGGGNSEFQIKIIREIYNFLEIDINESLLKKIANSIYSNQSKTFNKSQIGQWQKEFTAEIRNLFKETNGSILLDLGYEKDAKW